MSNSRYRRVEPAPDKNEVFNAFLSAPGAHAPNAGAGNNLRAVLAARAIAACVLRILPWLALGGALGAAAGFAFAQWG